MSIAMERRDLIMKVSCLVCNDQEASMLFSEEYEAKTMEEMSELLVNKIQLAHIRQMVVTMGELGAVYADINGNHGVIPPQKVDVIDTTGAGDSFFVGVTIGLTYGKSLHESCVIGTRLAASVIATKENVCPHFLPEEFDLQEN